MKNNTITRKQWYRHKLLHKTMRAAVLNVAQELLELK